jgi:hypothetical protein
MDKSKPAKTASNPKGAESQVPPVDPRPGHCHVLIGNMARTAQGQRKEVAQGSLEAQGAPSAKKEQSIMA